MIHVKDGKTGIKDGLLLPEENEFDVDICLKLVRKQTNQIKELLKDKNKYRFIPHNTSFDYDDFGVIPLICQCKLNDIAGIAPSFILAPPLS